ncbi:hypothetical protein LF887_10400 [Chryseobacterium sp. MEBOG06]|uniref:hypothetical protein n=1 Tax=Chryseobacterium sp. MEBOG06 TaxID=2879938 RepID=UPI001F3BEDB0|nr:hypothetical protein [Chryseobacterium sp. MEBOG06]UKB86009.1 hypothetical protein LF887_10400 [Chryseobacterium sp. MEBOG06]
MNYNLIQEVIELVQQFETENDNNISYRNDLSGFKEWMSDCFDHHSENETHWEGKENGRGADSVICTFLTHMSRYAKLYSKSAIRDSMFSTQEDFIYLITLKSFGAMSKDGSNQEKCT